MIRFCQCLAAVLFLAPCVAVAQEKKPVVLKHDGWVAAVAFSPDGKTLASAGADNVVRLWEVGTWKAKGVLKGHTDCVSAVAFNWFGDRLATGSFDHTAKTWSMEDRREIETLAGHKGVVTAVLIPDARPVRQVIVITASVDASVRMWPAEYRFDGPKHKSWVNALAYSRNDGFASGSSDGTVALTRANEKVVYLEGGAGEVRSVAFSPDGKLLAAGNRYHTVRVWDVKTRKEIKTLGGHMSDVWSIAFSPDGKTLAAADTDWKKPSKIKLWDTTTWKERGSLPTPGEILSIAYSPNGDWLAAGCWDKTVRVFAIAR